MSLNRLSHEVCQAYSLHSPTSEFRRERLLVSKCPGLIGGLKKLRLRLWAVYRYIDRYGGGYFKASNAPLGGFDSRYRRDWGRKVHCTKRTVTPSCNCSRGKFQTNSKPRSMHKNPDSPHIPGHLSRDSLDTYWISPVFFLFPLH